MFKIFLGILSLCISLVGCSTLQSPLKENSTTIAFVNFNGYQYVVTNNLVKSIGKEIGTMNHSDFYEIPGHDIREEIALKINNGYVEVIRKDIWYKSKGLQK
ncbi:hypothetical protein LSG31_07145 [Fodinisporobacter ferrooxydans]|uniref:Lipoprotein n=1 Tax=Fodinisporobacter ferrooxydans TaxID=2901836 RepID=A0ABY4CNU9_9BACL|nr:hypothetical protein LSG31_07145 [Alicyclobacillaceae bacterium MYW30-H2]